mgnify:CR=1 FL=1
MSGSAITNESAVRRCGDKRDRYSATATPTTVDSVAATSVSAALPPSAVQNPAVPKTRAERGAAFAQRVDGDRQHRQREEQREQQHAG